MSDSGKAKQATSGEDAEDWPEQTPDSASSKPQAPMLHNAAECWTCAICLDPICFEDLAVVKGCEHTYCVHCILKWSCVKESDRCCPTCKAPFSSLLVHRQLDGTLTDFEVEESVVLLARAVWFQDWLRTREKSTDLYKYPMFRSASAAESDLPPEALAREEYAEEALYQVFEDEYDDEDVEDFYLSAQAGSSRVTLGNRPRGANGYMRSGHRCARPSSSNAPRTPKGGGKAASNAQPKSAPARMGCAGSDGAGSSKGQGRRARRNARRDAVDAAAGCD